MLSNIPFVKCLASDFSLCTFSFFGSNSLYVASYLKLLNSKDIYTVDLIRSFRFQFGNISPFEPFIFNIIFFCLIITSLFLYLHLSLCEIIIIMKALKCNTLGTCMAWQVMVS